MAEANKSDNSVKVNARSVIMDVLISLLCLMGAILATILFMLSSVLLILRKHYVVALILFAILILIIIING